MGSAYNTAPTPKTPRKYEDVFNFEMRGSTYQFSIRIYQGQDTKSMLIGLSKLFFFSLHGLALCFVEGWASSTFCGRGVPMIHTASGQNDLVESTTRNVYVKIFDNNGGAKV